MELRQLEYIVAIADHGGFTKAATSLRVSQPSLSNGVRHLETELGIELFLRLGRTVQPTAAGEEVVDSARRVLREVTDLVAVSRAAGELHIGRLKVQQSPWRRAKLLRRPVRSAAPSLWLLWWRLGAVAEAAPLVMPCCPHASPCMWCLCLCSPCSLCP